MATQPDIILLSTLNTQIAQLAKDPKNEALRTIIFKNQVALTAGQLGTSTSQAADVVRSYTAGYIATQGGDPKAVLDALDNAQQQILNYDKNKPRLYGMDLVTANKVASYFAAAAGFATFASIVLVVVGIMMAGPEILAIVGAVDSIAGLFAAVVQIATGGTGGAVVASAALLFLAAQALGHFANYVPMTTKQMVDNGSIAPGLQITAIKDAEALRAQLTGSDAAGPYSKTQFNTIVNGFQAAGVTTVKDPTTGAISPFSRQAIANLVNTIYGQQVLAGSSATPTKITPLLSAYLGKGSVPSGSVAAPAPASSRASTTTTRVPSVKVFTGVISQGVLGTGVQFEDRPDDLIESADELHSAAANNLAALLAALPSSLTYDIKIVSSVITKDGFRQTGGTQQITTGVNKDGTPKVKTVSNKFATLEVFLTNEKGTRTKIRSIILGPTNVLKFNPGVNEVSGIEQSLQTDLISTNASDIKAISQPASALTVAPTAPQVDVQVEPYQIGIKVVGEAANTNGDVHYTYTYAGGGKWTVSDTLDRNYGFSVETTQQLIAKGVDLSSAATSGSSSAAAASANSDATATTTPAAVASASGVGSWCAATTLSAFFSARGQSLPSIASRSLIYQGLGLGQSSFYTGTAEQNVKLLAVLQQQAGCPI